MIIKNPSNDKFDIIIVAGQSNALGCGVGETKNSFVKNDKIFMLNEDFTADFVDDELKMTNTGICYLEIADERVENGEKKASFTLSFASKYAKNHLIAGRKLLLVQTAVGGTGFARHHWGENESLTVRMFEMVEQALKMNSENKIVAVLWHQGEHDMFRNKELNYNERYDFYYNKLYAFIKNLRDKYGKVPFISGSFCPTWMAQNERENVDAILDVYKKLDATIENFAFVYKTEDLKCNFQSINKGGDYVHFCRDSSYKLGRRYYKEYVKLQSKNL